MENQRRFLAVLLAALITLLAILAAFPAWAAGDKLDVTGAWYSSPDNFLVIRLENNTDYLWELGTPAGGGIYVQSEGFDEMPLSVLATWENCTGDVQNGKITLEQGEYCEIVAQTAQYLTSYAYGNPYVVKGITGVDGLHGPINDFLENRAFDVDAIYGYRNGSAGRWDVDCDNNVFPFTSPAEPETGVGLYVYPFYPVPAVTSTSTSATYQFTGTYTWEIYSTTTNPYWLAIELHDQVTDKVVLKTIAMPDTETTTAAYAFIANLPEGIYDVNYFLQEFVYSTSSSGLIGSWGSITTSTIENPEYSTGTVLVVTDDRYVWGTSTNIHFNENDQSPIIDWITDLINPIIAYLRSKFPLNYLAAFFDFIWSLDFHGPGEAAATVTLPFEQFGTTTNVEIDFANIGSSSTSEWTIGSVTMTQTNWFLLASRLAMIYAWLRWIWIFFQWVLRPQTPQQLKLPI